MNNNTPLPPFKWFALQNFPFIENTFDALTNYELMCKIVEYLNTVAQKTNVLGTEVEQLVNWFNNLDVQDEIDNKLDEMAESGELAEIINQEIFGQLNAKINLLTNERVLCVGDSYGVGTTYGGTITGWCDRLQTIRGLSNDNFIKLVEGSSGFTRTGLQGHTFQSLLEANYSSISHPETVTKVVVCGGHNEFNSDGPNLNGAINSFITYCKSHFVNAKIYVGMIGYDSRLTSAGKTVRDAIYRFILRSYQNSVRYGAIYLSGAENIMHDYIDFMSEDGIHPNDLGYNFLASYISNGLDGSYADFAGNYHSETFTATNSESTFTILSRIVNDMQTFFFDNNISISYETAFDWNGGATLQLASATPTNFAFHNRFIKIPVNYYAHTSDNAFYGGMGFLEFRENQIVIRNALITETGYPTIENVDAIVIQPASITVENGIC